MPIDKPKPNKSNGKTGVNTDPNTVDLLDLFGVSTDATEPKFPSYIESFDNGEYDGEPDIPVSRAKIKKKKPTKVIKNDVSEKENNDDYENAKTKSINNKINLNRNKKFKEVILDDFESSKSKPVTIKTKPNHITWRKSNIKKPKIEELESSDSSLEQLPQQPVSKKPIKQSNKSKSAKSESSNDAQTESSDSEPGKRPTCKTQNQTKVKNKIFSRNTRDVNTESEEEIIEPKPTKTTSTNKKQKQPSGILKNVNNNDHELKQLKINTCLEQMISGTLFFKYTSNGDAHFRLFRLSKDKKYIIWCPTEQSESLLSWLFGKSQDKRILYIDQITHIIPGQQTSNFGNQMKNYSSQSFSIIYDGGTKSIDLMASEKDDYDTWFTGLKYLIQD